jgi:hypothetical protein
MGLAKHIEEKDWKTEQRAINSNLPSLGALWHGVAASETKHDVLFAMASCISYGTTQPTQVTTFAVLVHL